MPRRSSPRAAAIAAAIALAATGCSSDAPKPAAPAAPPARAGAPAAPAAGSRGAALPALPDLPTQSFVEVAVPGGTTLEIALSTPLASNRSRIEDPVRASVTADVQVRGKTAIPKGTAVTGTVLEVNAASRSREPATIAFRLLELHPYDAAVRIRTDRMARTADAPGTELTLPAGTTFQITLDDAIRVQVPTR